MKVFSYEEVSGYSPILSIKRDAFLKKYEKKALFLNKATMFFYITYKISLLFIFSLTIYYSMHIAIIVVIALVIPLFISVVDRELYNFAIRKMTLDSEDSFLHKFTLEAADGWYDDPYANGMINRQREWIKGKWTKNIRIFPTQTR